MTIKNNWRNERKKPSYCQAWRNENINFYKFDFCQKNDFSTMRLTFGEMKRMYSNYLYIFQFANMAK